MRDRQFPGYTATYHNFIQGDQSPHPDHVPGHNVSLPLSADADLLAQPIEDHRIAAAGAEASSTSLAQNSTSGSGSSADA